MSDDRSRRGLNPNARAFIPNPNVPPFIPESRFQTYSTQPYMHMQGAPRTQYQMPFQPSSMYSQCSNPTPTPTELVIPATDPFTLNLASTEQEIEQDVAENIPSSSWDEEEEAGLCTAQQKTEGDEAFKDCGDVINQDEDEDKEPMSSTALEADAENVAEKIGSVYDNEVVEYTDEVIALSSKYKRTLYVEDKSRKEHVNLVFIGHVDAGKSTICGQIMYLCGMVDKRTLEKYEKEAKDKGRESWYLSWALDTNEEEREKGKTVECGRAYFETEHRHYTILDAPGHKSFVPNMISGASQADLAIMVISARKGEFETGFVRGGQTQEHAMLVKTAGVRHIIILVNKMDDPTVEWDEERFLAIESKLSPFLRKLGFSKSDIVFIPVSGLLGDFLKACSADLAPWYTGPCFIEYLDMMPSLKRDFNGPVRVIVAEKYNDMGTIIIGKMESGVIAKGDQVIVMPNKISVQVNQLWSDDVETDKVVAGDNVKLKLRGIEDSEILAGFVLCSSDSLCHFGRIFDAEVYISEYKSIIASGYSCVLHIQSAVEEVNVVCVICTIDKKTGEKKRARFVKQDEKCIMRLESAEPFCLEPYKDFPQLGRFTLRDEGRTVAIGKVLKVIE